MSSPATVAMTDGDVEIIIASLRFIAMKRAEDLQKENFAQGVTRDWLARFIHHAGTLSDRIENSRPRHGKLHLPFAKGH